MTTARDLLLLDVQKLVQTPCSPAASGEIAKTLERYRVQAKPTTQLRDGVTAREALGEEVLALWRSNSAQNAESQLRVTIDCYRMQLKQPMESTGAGAKPKIMREVAPKSKFKLEKRKLDAIPNDDSPKKLKKGAKIEIVKRAILSEPVAGGPQKRNRSRGQCPKCHSMGVVLARSYAGDEYFSCIYCGFQAYRASLDAELDLPLAAELLGRRFDDREEVEEKG